MVDLSRTEALKGKTLDYVDGIFDYQIESLRRDIIVSEQFHLPVKHKEIQLDTLKHRKNSVRSHLNYLIKDLINEASSENHTTVIINQPDNLIVN